MAKNRMVVLSFFSPRIIAKAVTTLDKSTTFVVGSCWAAAFVILILAVFAVRGAVSAQKDAMSALVAEPVVPVAQKTSIDAHEVQVTMDRMQHQFPDVKIESGGNQSVIIRSNDGSRFHQWVAALSYVDSMSPQIHWTLNEFCVGNCKGSDLMRAAVSGERVTFSLPQK